MGHEIKPWTSKLTVAEATVLCRGWSWARELCCGC